MRHTTIEEHLESRYYADKTRARRELYGEISDLFHIAGDFPDILVRTHWSGTELVPFEEYLPPARYEMRDPKTYPSGVITDLLTEIISPNKYELIEFYCAEENVTIQGPTEQVRELYSKLIKESD